MFFFEKGTKKLLLFLCVWLNVARQHEKVFRFFFQKRSACLSSRGTIRE